MKSINWKDLKRVINTPSFLQIFCLFFKFILTKLDVSAWLWTGDLSRVTPTSSPKPAVIGCSPQRLIRIMKMNGWMDKGPYSQTLRRWHSAVRMKFPTFALKTQKSALHYLHIDKLHGLHIAPPLCFQPRANPGNISYPPYLTHTACFQTQTAPQRSL